MKNTKGKGVLYINLGNTDKKLKVLDVIREERAEVISVSDTELSGLPDDAELMKIRGFSDTELRHFLNSLREKGLSVDYKCVETEMNQNWKLKDLYKELKAEHEYMHGKKDG